LIRDKSTIDFAQRHGDHASDNVFPFATKD